MTPAGYSRLFAAALISAATNHAATARSKVAPAIARSKVAPAIKYNHDGIYAVDIVTQQGSCDRGYHWLIAVSGGRISSAWDTPMEASGQISRRGIVHVAFERFGQVATVTGKVARGSGSGTWSSPTMLCAGSWRATRQG
jgi:hypothetical protein